MKKSTLLLWGGVFCLLLGICFDNVPLFLSGLIVFFIGEVKSLVNGEKPDKKDTE